MNNSNTSIRYVRPKDLANHLSVSISTIWRYAKRPDFPMPVKLSEKVTAFNVDEVNEWCERKKTVVNHFCVFNAMIFKYKYES